VIENNEAAKIGTNYTIDVADGMFVVAYPMEDVQTEFEFKYWVAVYDKTVLDHALDFDFDGPLGKRAMRLVILFFVLVFFFILCCIGCIIRMCRRSRQNDKVMILAEETELKGMPQQLANTSTVNIGENDIFPTEEADASKISMHKTVEQTDFDGNNFSK